MAVDAYAQVGLSPATRARLDALRALGTGIPPGGATFTTPVVRDVRPQRNLKDRAGSGKLDKVRTRGPVFRIQPYGGPGQGPSTPAAPARPKVRLGPSNGIAAG